MLFKDKEMFEAITFNSYGPALYGDFQVRFVPVEGPNRVNDAEKHDGCRLAQAAPSLFPAPS
jgi:hypothetical protein